MNFREVIGIRKIQDFNIWSRLEECLNNTEEAKARQGALFVYQEFFKKLGYVLEPFTVLCVPHLLDRFSDNKKQIVSTKSRSNAPNAWKN